MSGKPAARISDSVSGGKIVTGSRTVLIGSQGGIACSECPGGVTVGSPVSPSLGVKILMGASELDFALPGAMPVVWQRQYSSYVNPEQGARCSLLGYGWSLPSEMRIELKDDACLLHGAMGRTITFDPLVEGELIYSQSEDVLLLRGGPDAAWSSQERFQHVPRELARNSQCIIVTSGDVQMLRVLRPGTVLPESTEAAAAHDENEVTGVHFVLQCKLDRFGRRQSYERDDHDRVVGITDGVGRQYRLILQQLHAAQAARYLRQADSGWRLMGVDLVNDPLVAGASESVALVRYGYSRAGDLITVHDRAGRLVREFAWQSHQMTAHRHLGGPRHSYRYESLAPGARVVEHASEEGLTYRFEYEQTTTGSTTRVSDSLQRVDIYRFEGEGGLSRLVEHVRADGSKVRRAYDTAGRLVEINDPLGRVTRLRYDGEGNLLGSQGPDGSQSNRSFDPVTGRVQTITDATGRITSFVYDAWGRMTRVTLSDGSTEQNEYPTPEDDLITCDRPVRIIDAKGGVKHLAWSSAGQMLRHTDCSGSTSEMQYNRWGQRIEIRNALGQSVRYVYDGAGNLDAVHHPNGSITRYRYNMAGRMEQVLPPDGGTGVAQNIGFSYDLWGRVVRQRHADLELRFAYDLAGRITELTNANGARTRFVWDVVNRRVQEEGFDGRVQSYRYDAAGQLVEVTDGNAHDHLRTRYAWDISGRLIETQIPATEHCAARIERLTWDPVGQLMATRSYLIHYEDQSEHLQTEALSERDRLGRLVGETQRVYKIEFESVPTPAQPSIEFEHTIAHSLDILGNRQLSELQDMGKVDYLMYGAGHVHGVLYNGESILDFERDALHRETRRQQILKSDAQSHAVRGALQTQRRWDVLGRLEKLGIEGLMPWIAVDGNAPHALMVGQLSQRDYHYDALGQLAAIQTPDGQRQYSYDVSGRLIGARGPEGEQHWRFDPAGNRLPPHRGDNARSIQVGDTDDWATLVRSQWRGSDFDVLGHGRSPQADPQPLRMAERWQGNRVEYGDDAVYLYDNRGNRVQATRRDGSNIIMRYDGANQLIEVQVHTLSSPAKQGGAVAAGSTRITTSRYIYDPAGRRLMKTVKESSAGQTATLETRTCYGWDGDRLVHTEQRMPGRVKQVMHTVYEPGSFAPLLQLSKEGDAPPKGLASLVAHAEDAETQEALRDALKSLPDTMRLDLESQMQKLIQNGASIEAHRMSGQSAKANPTTEDVGLIQAGNMVIAAVQEKTKATYAAYPVAVRHYHCDYLGTPQALTDEQGQLVWMALSDPWGNLQEEYNPLGIDQLIRLPGQHQDKETGLHYNRYRYYDPSLGAYVNQDPIGLQGGINSAAYANSNPVGAIDPLGLDCTAAGGSVSCVTPGGSIAFPRPSGWPDAINSSVSKYHVYDIKIPLNGADPDCVRREIAKNPTPGTPSPATPQGTPNNATPSTIQGMFDAVDYVSSFGNDPGGYSNSPVNSYSLNGGSVVANVTAPGHPLHSGYVARFVDGGYVHNYGEGVGWLQGEYSPFAGPINNVWQGQTAELLKKCGCKN